MPRIPYTATGFPPEMTALRDPGVLTIEWSDLIWSAISVGKRGLDDMLSHSHHSLDEILYRIYMVQANLWENSGFIHRSPAYDDLDPTEKGSISYFIGMAIAKLFAFRLFDAPWMVHLDRMIDRNLLKLSGRSRPDLIGQDLTGRWIILEGKGRTGLEIYFTIRGWG